MPVDPKLRAMMGELDACSGNMEEWAYKKLCDQLMHISKGLDENATRIRHELAIEMIKEKPECISTLAVYQYTQSVSFMQGLVRAKALDLQEFDHLGPAMARIWKQEVADALLDYKGRPRWLLRVRLGVLSLLVARSSFLPQIVARLDALKVTPSMLCPHDLNAPLLNGDEGKGPNARDLLRHEPRLLRWLLGLKSGSPWPNVSDRENYPRHVRRIIRRANSQGGDDPEVNGPCTCPQCIGLPTLPMDPAASIAPSDDDDDDDDDDASAPSSRPRSPHPLPSPPLPSPVRRSHAMLTRARTHPYRVAR